MIVGSNRISGLDLGQKKDFSAFVTLTVHPKPSPVERTLFENHFQVDNIYRWELGTPYPEIVRDLRRWYVEEPIKNSTLIIDATGVGAPVVDMVREARLPANVQAYSITAGLNPNEELCTVPKKDLVAAVDAAGQSDRLLFAKGLKYAHIVKKELETFQMKVTAERNETFAAWRESDHDDMVLALALAVWYGEIHWRPPMPPDSAGRKRTPYDDLPPGTFLPGKGWFER